ncbi:methyltransferase domain-containing protein [Agromyces mariniharenae]|uniref:Methyltransferase domain-containing protein n=1 Tax=Agromyces mariniharenae TaxID=2604423 RepID=A0A5S4UWI7_9MICO|nr:methyltransferase domain-containing protein [Agromyces mariniharenae]TYL50936.1 methyltransferase domain-containing protein [Agromyces mariniharenae]
MSIDTTWLRCPNCLLDLDPVGERTLGCETGHRFDLSKHGIVTLLPPKAPRTVGDDRAMLDARAALLDSGAYAPIAASIVEALSSAGIDGATDAPRIADLGCGTGYYSALLADALPTADFLLADRSPDAVRMSRRAIGGSTGVVLDTWRPLPVRDAVADVVLDVFAPRNPPEFARILRPGGVVVVVVPTADHLHELRAEGAMLDVPAEKAELVSDRFHEAGLRRGARTTVTYPLEATAATQALLVDMGPAAHHADRRPHQPEHARTVTVSVDVLVFEHAAGD